MPRPVTLLVLVALAGLPTLPALGQPAEEPKVEVVARGLVNPWGMAFLPDGRALVTERPGRLRIVNLRAGAAGAPITGLPPIAAVGQGGLLGLALDPDFATTRQVFLCFAESRDGGTAIGPWLVDRDDIADPMNLALRTEVKGRVVQEGHTGDMIHDVASLIEYLSSFMTLSPGDVILTGTPKGSVDVQPGDEVVCEVQGVGRLLNTLVADWG